jgi:hypothetical protein
MHKEESYTSPKRGSVKEDFSLHGEDNDKDSLLNAYNTYLRRSFPNSEPI